jgi:HK97 gp10 family phage protein
MTLRGVDDVNDLLGRIAPKQATNIMRATVHDMAGEVRKDAKANVPVDEGDLRRAIKARREQVKYGKISSTVRVARSAFYWRFLEYGDGPDGVEHAFFARAVEKLSRNMHRQFLLSFGKKWEAALRRARKRNGG